MGPSENVGFTLSEMGVLEGFIARSWHHPTYLEIDHTGCHVANRQCVLGQSEAAGPGGRFCLATAKVMNGRSPAVSRVDSHGLDGSCVGREGKTQASAVPRVMV